MQTVDVRRLNLASGARTLDLGCGRGRHAHAVAIQSGGHVVALDLDSDELGAAAEGFAAIGAEGGWSAVRGDAFRLPFADAAFDCVICSEVLEHLHDYEGAVCEIARILRPGGVLALSVPRAWPERICWRLSESYHKTPGGHVRIFDARMLRDSVGTAGFRLTARHGAHALHSPYWWLRCARGARADSSRLVSAYKRLLEWDILERPWVTRTVEALLNPVLGKSVVMYFERTAAP